MTRRRTGQGPADLERTRERFEQWRRTRKNRCRIPKPLWTAAAKMASRHGLYRTARALGVDYYGLKRRVQNQAANSSEPADARISPFLELSAPEIASTREWVLELEDGGGAKMRIHIKGEETVDLVALTRSFWGVQP